MDVKDYREFVLVADDVEKDESGLHQFTVSVFSSPAGEGKRDRRPVPIDLKAQLGKLERRALEMDQIIALGEALADLLLPDKTRGLFVRSLDRLGPEEGLRLRLRLAPELADIPWEYMYIQRGNGEKDTTGFLALDPRISVVRHEAVPVGADMVTKPRSRRLLLALASPAEAGCDSLDLDRELNNMKRALAGVKGIELDVLENATLERLNESLLRNTDVFHFAGHGNFRQTGYGQSFASTLGYGEILLIAEDGSAIPLPADQMAVNLRGKGIQLAVLGACETGRRDGQNVWSGVVAALMEVGIPAVLAMQYKIWDEAAIAFSRSLYQALSGGLSLDQAISAGRLAAFNLCHSNREDLDLGCFWQDWGAPVFYLRSDCSFFLTATANADERKALLEGPRTVVSHRFTEIGSQGNYRAVEAGAIQGGIIESHLKVDRMKGTVNQVKADTIAGGRISTTGEAGTLEGNWTGVSVKTLGGKLSQSEPILAESPAKQASACPGSHRPVQAGSKFCSGCQTQAPCGASTQTLDFSEYIAERTRNFTGRDWVFAEIDSWLAQSDAPRFFIITGEPGIGKTSIAARLTQIHRVGAFHFCINRKADTINPFLFARSISQQLCSFDGFAAGILKDGNINLSSVQNIQANYGQAIGNKIETLMVNAPSASLAFTHAVTEPLKALYAGGFNLPVVILVDALDEAVQHKGPETIVDLLANSGDLPEKVRFVLTTRPEGAVLRHFEQCKIPNLLLNASRPENLKDISAYIQTQLNLSPLLRERLNEQKMPQDKFIKSITEGSRGNFLYLVWLLPAIAAGTQRFDSLDALPQGLDGIYREFLRTRKLGNEEKWRNCYRPLLGLLAAAREPLTRSHLVKFTAFDVQTVRDFLDDIRQFLDPTGFGQDSFQLYHRSVTDFLTQETRAQEFWIELTDVHGKIIDYYTGLPRWDKCDAYGFRQLINHLHTRLDLEKDPDERKKQVRELFSVILNTDFRAAQMKKLDDPRTTLADLRTALDIALEMDEIVAMLGCIGAYRDTLRQFSIVRVVFEALRAGDFDRALQAATFYESLPEWSGILCDYLAWEAAEDNQAGIVARIRESSKALALTQTQDLHEALWVRIARTLAKADEAPQSAIDWLTRFNPGKDAGLLLKSHEAPQPLAPAVLEQIINQLKPRLQYLEQMIGNGRAEGAAECSYGDEIRAGDFAGELKEMLQKVAAHPEGREFADRALKAVLMNPYPRYRDILLTAVAVACAAVPDRFWIRERFQRMLAVVLDREGVSFTFDLPFMLLTAAGQRNIPDQGLSVYLETAYKTSDGWGTEVRAQSAYAAALFSAGKVDDALQALVAADRHNIGMAGYSTLTLLSLADRCYEFGHRNMINACIWGPKNNIALLEGAMAVAQTVQDPNFREDRTNLVNAYCDWSKMPDSAIQEHRIKQLLGFLSPHTPLDPEASLEYILWMPLHYPMFLDHDVRMAFLAHAAARSSWPPDSPKWNILKLLLPMALGNATTLDAILGRMIRLRMHSLSDDEISEAIAICAASLADGRPWEFGQWR